LCEKGEKADSLAAFQQALRARKDDAEICAHYARALQKMDRGKDAISQMRKACSLAPDSIEHCTALGMLLEENARYGDAVAAFEKAVRLRPDVGFVWYRKGKLLNGLKRYADAAVDLEKAVALPGALPGYFYEYGVALQMSKRAVEALQQYDRGAALGLDKHEMHCNRGVILKELNRHSEAIQAFYKAVRLAPENEHYVNNLGAAALDIGLNSEALECFQDAVASNPNLQTAQNNIGNLLKDRGRGAEALAHYRRSMELAEGNFAASRLTKNNYLLCWQYLPEVDPEKVFEEHKKWGMDTVRLLRPAFNHSSRKIPAGEKLRVGFVSADFCQHPVGVFMEPLLRELAGERFEIFAYADYKQADSVSERMKATVPNWRETGSLTDAELAKKIHEDEIDVLFELSGHTALNRIDLFALKPAPIQATYLGYPSTTGLPAIDFRLTDAEADPAGMTEKFHTEKLVRIAGCAWSFSPHDKSPEIAPLPALTRGSVTFGCFNNMAKWNEPLYELWLEILRRVPGSRLKLKARTLLDDLVRGELETWFTERGIERERLEFTGHSKGIANHLNEYNKVDIALDSYPYHGTTTTCEALWMGCPVVTLEGKSHVSRVGVSLLKSVGLPECIAKTREDYIDKAVALAGDLDALADLRSGLRARLQSSPIMDAPGFARRFEAAIDEMVRMKKAK
jgi:predicted O-linked N-acetylglucosamine transferase (SPINDLY family)